MTRLRAVSERMTLTVAQLAVAREYGFPSWTALQAEVQRRRAETARQSPRVPEDGRRWSFGGGTALATAAGVLLPDGLLTGAGHTSLDAWLMPAPDSALTRSAGRNRLSPPGGELLSALFGRRPAPAA